ncbi:hypothetical protein ACFQE4_14285 [Streptomyces thermocoprophilus]|uniref:Integral membrane protein n=2 Tax=Streptomyces TaxID=1883 RepID=A0ABV5VJE1_9ACTN
MTEQPYQQQPYPQQGRPQQGQAQQPGPYQQTSYGQQEAYGQHAPHQEPHGHRASYGHQGSYGHEASFGHQASFGQQPYDEDPQQQTQQWQGRTWETHLQAPVTAVGVEETAYLPPQAYAAAPQQEALAPQTAAPPTAPQAHARRQPHRPQPAPAAAVAPAAPAAPAPYAQPAQPAAEPQEPAYGPATLGGNARITDAQRARLEGRSPIIDPGMQPALLTALLGLLLSGAAAVGTYALLVPLVVLQGVTAAGWFRLNGMWPARQGIALAFLGALVADAAVLAAGREHGPAAVLGTLGVWVLLCLVLQLRSHADPDERMYGLMATVVAAALSVLAAGYLAADADAVTVGAAAVAVALVARALPMPTPASVVVALLAAAGAGVVVGGMTGLGSKGALLGAAAAVCALIGHRVAAYDYPSRFVHFTAGVALPLTAAAPVAYILGRALG